VLLSDFVYSHLEEFEGFPSSLFEKLKKLKESKNREEFKELLKISFELNRELEKKSEEIFYRITRELLTIEEIVKFLEPLGKTEEEIKKLFKYLEPYYQIVDILLREKESFDTLYDYFVNKKESIDIGNYLNKISMVLRELAKYNKALEIQKKALEIDEKVLDKDDLNLAISYNNIALIYQDLEENQKALEYQRKALGIGEKILDKDDLSLAFSYNNIALTYHNLENSQKALEYQEKAIDIREKVLETNHPDLATSYNNIAGIYESLKEYKKALIYQQKAIDIREKVLETNHPDLATSYNNIAGIYLNLKEYQKAFIYQEKATEIQEKILDKIHPHLQNSNQNLKYIIYKINSIYKLNRVKIESFKKLESIEVEFDERVNIIIGDNSSGKTSLLKAISLALLEQNSKERVKIDYDSLIQKQKSEAKIRLDFEGFSKNVTLKDNKKTIDFDEYRGFFLAYGANFFTSNFEAKNIVKDILEIKEKKYFIDSLFKDFDDSFYNPESILQAFDLVTAQFKEQKEQIEKIKADFINIINSFLSDFKLKFESNRYFFEGKKENRYKLEELSEGYRNNILLISDILLRIYLSKQEPKEAKGIILIDEFDRHLNPNWQVNLVDELLNAFPNIQFILTTHNPMSILNREKEQVIILKETDGKIEAQKRDIDTKKIDVGSVLLYFFGVESLVGSEFRESIKKYNALALKDELDDKEQRELDELKNLFDDSIFSEYISDKRYFRFLKFLKEKNIDIDEIDEDDFDEYLKEFEDLL